MVVNCNTCKKDFEIEIKTSYKFGLEIQYFVCPHCKVKYTYVVIDDYIRERQKKVQDLREKIKECTKQKQVNKLTKQQDKILRDMKKHSDELIEAYEKIKPVAEKCNVTDEEVINLLNELGAK